MSGNRKRGKAGAEHRSTHSSSVNKRTAASESVDGGGRAENLVLMCSCGSSGPSKEEIWKEDSVEQTAAAGAAAAEKKGEKEKDTAVAALAMVPERAATIEEVPPPKRDSVDEQQQQQEEPEDSESGTRMESSAENSFDETEAPAAMTMPEERMMNSTSLSQEIYRTPLLSPDLWPREDADEIHQDLENMKLDSSGGDDEAADRKVESEDEKSPDPPEIQRDEEAPVESTPGNYDRLTADVLMSVIESHRDALNDQKVLLSQQTDAINRLASAVEKQTKIIATFNENKLPIHN